MQLEAIKRGPHCTLVGAAQLPPVFKAQLTAHKVAKEGDVRNAAVSIHVRVALQISVNSNLIDAWSQVGPHRLQKRA